MGRQRQPQIRQRILDACTDHALQHGLPDRLTPLAAAAGVSGRMLIYHFGTRDELLRAILREARHRQVASFGELLRVRDGERYTVTLARAWGGLIGPVNRPYLRMFGWLREQTDQQLWPDFRLVATTDWLAPLERGMAGMDRPELATTVLAVIRGLMMDLDATGDTARTGRAFVDFLDLVDGGAPTATGDQQDGRVGRRPETLERQGHARAGHRLLGHDPMEPTPA